MILRKGYKMAVESRVVSVSDGSLSYSIDGDGQWLVLLHAGIADSRMWDAQMNDFSRHFRVLRYDMRGYGHSSDLKGPFSHHEDLKILLDTLNIHRTHVVGLSMGASVALDFTLSNPEMVDRLVLCAALGNAPYSDSLMAGWTEAEEAFKRGGLTAVNEVEIKIWVDGPKRKSDQIDPTVRALVADMNLPVLEREEIAEHESTPLDPPASSRLSEIAAQTLVLAGELDQPDVLEFAAQLVTEIPTSRLEIILGAAHMVNMEDPRRFNSLVGTFLRE